MNVCEKCCVRMLAVILLLCFANAPRVVAQDQRHVVSVEELSKDTARPAEARQANEAALRQLFSSEQAQQALKSATRLAERSRQMQNNFAAGRAGSLSDRDLLIIIVIAVLVIALVAVLR